MGIPKFFRWMSERYPHLCQTARDSQLPEIDNFYLDMNGIIHNCSHPCDGDVHFRISEQEMFEDIFNYVSTLFTIMKPRKYFFMAVDGVAPRAKMNQQRGRRFRSAKEASDREDNAVRQGAILPTEQRFDSNCITPGTDFMVKLNHALKQFVETKLTTDPEWQHVKVILSGHETPGEGEHKIMDFIRFQRSQPNYDPSTRHCLYGLDTDLIMLGLSSHEPYFMLLREEIKFTNRKEAARGKSQRVDPSRINFNVLYLSLLRDYIEQDFEPLKASLPYKFDLECIIDDWILICFLVGNDFIPHIPHFHIHKNALPRLFEAYRDVLPKMDGYLNEDGFLNLNRFRLFAEELSDMDVENLSQLSDPMQANHSLARARVAGARPRYNNGNNANGNNRGNREKNYYQNHSLNQQSGVWLNVHRHGNTSGGNGNGNKNYYQQQRHSHSDSRHSNNNYSNQHHHQHHNNNNHNNGLHSNNGKPQYTSVNGVTSIIKIAANGFPGIVPCTNGAGNVAGNNSVEQFGHSNSKPTNASHNNHNNSSSINNNNNNGVKDGARKSYSNVTIGNNGSPRVKPGVHNFSERQLNSSIKLCADGDFMDLSDGEYSSDEKFPSDEPANHGARHGGNHNSNSYNNNNSRQQAMNGIGRQFKGLNVTDSGHQRPNGGGSNSAHRSTNRGSGPPPAKASIKEAPSKAALKELDEHKRDYYRTKFKIEPSDANIRTVVHEYIRALQWNLHYYYHGCVSWAWYYPYHYAPFISDVKNMVIGGVDLHFELGEPLRPFEQLLAVLPPASSLLLPKIYRNLVMADDSPLAQYFPTEVEYDLNGKQNDWEAVVLTPFIDETALIKSTTVCNLFLSPDERIRNVHGPHLLYECQFYNNNINGNTNTNKNGLHQRRNGGGGGGGGGGSKPQQHTNANSMVNGQGNKQQFVAKVLITEIPVRGFNLPVDRIKFGLLLHLSKLKPDRKLQGDTIVNIPSIFVVNNNNNNGGNNNTNDNNSLQAGTPSTKQQQSTSHNNSSYHSTNNNDSNSSKTLRVAIDSSSNGNNNSNNPKYNSSKPSRTRTHRSAHNGSNKQQQHLTPVLAK